MQFLKIYLKQKRMGILLFVLCGLIFFSTFLLYHLPMKAVLYPTCLCLVIVLLFFLLDFPRTYEKHRQLLMLQDLSEGLMDSLPEITGMEDADYQRLIELLCEKQRALSDEMNARYVDMVEYYSVWAHQIKTPIASMRLRLQNEDSSLSRQLAGDLFRIEQYVEMVLTFLRLDSDSTDYVFKEHDLDTLVRQAVKKFSGEFIGRGLRLEYSPFEMQVITDEKWLSFVIEQILSNALKYTPQGSVKIYLEQPKILCIQDTGMGIAPEDLPRIFEKGYTGYNGRSNKKASGIGLYLCKRACHNLGHKITAWSQPDKGTVIRIDLNQTKLEIE